MKTLNKLIRDKGFTPCLAATKWLGRRRNAQKAWDDLPDPLWMVWVLNRAKLTKKFRKQIRDLWMCLYGFQGIPLPDHSGRMTDIYFYNPTPKIIRKFIPNPPALRRARFNIP